MHKRQLLIANFSPVDIQRLRELISYRARIDTIKALLPLPHIETVTRLLYEITPDSNPPRGSRAPVGQIVSKTYSSRSCRLALSEMYNQFDDLRKSGFSFQDTVSYVYRAYARKNHHLVFVANPLSTTIRFEHFYSIALDLESKHSNLVRCTSCGARNLLTQLLSSYSLQCVFCDVVDANRATVLPKTANAK